MKECTVKHLIRNLVEHRHVSVYSFTISEYNTKISFYKYVCLAPWQNDKKKNELDVHVKLKKMTTLPQTKKKTIWWKHIPGSYNALKLETGATSLPNRKCIILWIEN